MQSSRVLVPLGRRSGCSEMREGCGWGSRAAATRRAGQKNSLSPRVRLKSMMGWDSAVLRMQGGDKVESVGCCRLQGRRRHQGSSL